MYITSFAFNVLWNFFLIVEFILNRRIVQLSPLLMFTFVCLLHFIVAMVSMPSF